MKKILSCLLFIIAIFSVVSLQAQTADDIVNKYVDAIGGKDVVNKVNSIYMEGSTEVMGNGSATIVNIINGKGYKSESDFGGQKLVQCYTDKGGWTINPMAGGNVEALSDEAYKSARGQIYIAGALYDYAAKGSTVELLTKEDKNYKLKLVSKDKTETIYYIDPSTYLLNKLTRSGVVNGQGVQINMQFSDYKKTDIGYTLPYSVNLDLGQFQLTTTYTKVEVNKTIDPAIFNMPK